METNTLFYLILGILIAEFLIDKLLDYLNAKRFSADIPSELADLTDKETQEKSVRYLKTKYRYGIWESLFTFVFTLGFIGLGGIGWVDDWARSITEHPIGVALLFFGAIGLVSSILRIPFSYYNTFVIEAEFGFNKSTVGLFFSDYFKSLVLGAVLGGGILALVILIYDWAGPQFWIYAWICIGIFTVLLNLFYSKWIVPLFNKQRPMEESPLKQLIADYSKEVDFGLKDIFVIDGSKRSTKANAYFSGFGNQKRITLYDTLINDLEEDEIVAVLAHEVGHYKHRHIITNMVVSLASIGLTLYLLSLCINYPELSLALGASEPAFHVALIAFGILYGPFSELTGLAMNYVSRKFEFQADDYAKNTFGSAPLVGALKKLSKNSLSNLNPHPAYVFMHYSHPPLLARIHNLRS
ncbi:M48 family metallopeptidase [Sediminicola luteus]|uniref:Peptidase M48 n=1 Tax=Sediminicola luteus TaxID=319238 RepID=A0A2A4GA62_9FLAO|nr:M48 family metallopeptidase [Sediminicola luteus]PCE64864.1 peptidase M48 [Sediminicola luteus]